MPMVLETIRLEVIGDFQQPKPATLGVFIIEEAIAPYISSFEYLIIFTVFVP